MLEAFSYRTKLKAKTNEIELFHMIKKLHTKYKFLGVKQ